MDAGGMSWAFIDASITSWAHSTLDQKPFSNALIGNPRSRVAQKVLCAVLHSRQIGGVLVISAGSLA